MTDKEADMDYPEFRSRAENLCVTESEKERLSEELELIEKRGWEQYIALFAGILEKVRSLDHHIPAGGSIRHSYALSRVVEPERDISYRLGMKKQKDDFFSSNLEYGSFLAWKFPFGRYLRFRKIRRIILDSIISCGLSYRLDVRKKGRDRVELIVVSTSDVPDEDIHPAWKPYDMRTPGEKERLMKYLIITLRTYHCR